MSESNTHPEPVRLTAVYTHAAPAILVQRLNGSQNSTINLILLQHSPEQVPRYPVVGLLQIYECCVDRFGHLPGFLEDLVKSEELVRGPSPRAESTLPLLDLGFGYLSASSF